MNKTQNYQLNQWEAEDRVLRTDFNADNAKIDAALGALSGRAQIAVGTYTGNGAESRFISAGFTPKAVLVFTTYGESGIGKGTGSHVTGGLALTGSPVVLISNGTTFNVIKITESGFYVSYKDAGASNSVCTNLKNTNYNYLAIG